VILNRRCKPLRLVDRDIEVEIEVELGPPDGWRFMAQKTALRSKRRNAVLSKSPGWPSEV